MKRKLSIVLLTLVLVLCVIFGLTACRHEHSYVTNATDPTCTEKGYTTYVCSCGDSYIADYVDEIGHDYNNGICFNCSYNLFENIDGIELNAVSEENIGAFVENVKSNSTQGAIDFKKYGAQIKFVGYETINSTKYKKEDVVNVKYENNIYNAQISASLRPATLSVAVPDGEDFQIYDFEHTAFIVDKIIYSTQPNPLNRLAEITDCSGFLGYNSIADIIIQATVLEIEIGREVQVSRWWEFAVAQLPMVFEIMLYQSLSANYFYLKTGNYYIIKVVADDQYMENVEMTYVYDEEYDLVGFIGNNKIGENVDTKMTIKPLYDDVIIPSEVIEKICEYN
ncbi:MAG: hypothetical protein E7347_06265 [Clostridiales bacterium]|nr:hypothetical protein [Clostridiales bacterium]